VIFRKPLRFKDHASDAGNVSIMTENLSKIRPYERVTCGWR